MSLSDLVTKDFSRYSNYLAAVGSLTELFSDNDRPLINSRTAERLFVFLTGARDLSRKDNSFDACLGIVGVGIKTFTAPSVESASLQKVAEFSNTVDRNHLRGLKPKQLATEVSRRRNHRLASHATQLGISIDESYYHCLVRVPGGMVIFETELNLIDIDNIRPLDSKGRIQDSWPRSVKENSSVRFTDGLNVYSFHHGKSVLMMKFDLKDGLVSKFVKVQPVPNIFDILLRQFPSTKSLRSESSGLRLGPNSQSSDQKRSMDSVVLPLFSPRTGEVSPKSGLNQWLGKGDKRKRTFGEAYVPIPSIVHEIAPGFFPSRNTVFSLVLPNSEKVKVKVCQQGDKALMSNPNSDLGEWLMAAIDGSLLTARKRFSKSQKYTRKDLERVGSDSLRITRTGDPNEFMADFAAIGSFEIFLEAFELQVAPGD